MNQKKEYVKNAITKFKINEINSYFAIILVMGSDTDVTTIPLVSGDIMTLMTQFESYEKEFIDSYQYGIPNLCYLTLDKTEFSSILDVANYLVKMVNT